MTDGKASYFTGVGGRHDHLDGPSGVGGHACPEIDAAPKDKPRFFWPGFSNPHHVWETKGPHGVAPFAVPG